MATQHVARNSNVRGWRGSTMGGFLGYLDEAEKAPSNRVLAILQLMLEIQSLQKTGTTSVITQKKDELDRKLSGYKFFPDLLPGRSGGWRREWHILPVGRKGWPGIESGVLEMILGYAISGKLARLGKCRECSKWMYAKFRHQTFCSPNCQQRHYRHSDKGKQKKRQYMRKYRREYLSKRKDLRSSGRSRDDHNS